MQYTIDHDSVHSTPLCSPSHLWSRFRKSNRPVQFVVAATSVCAFVALAFCAYSWGRYLTAPADVLVRDSTSDFGPGTLPLHPTFVAAVSSLPLVPGTRIPKIVHQTWHTNMVPSTFAKWTLSWRQNHPDWMYVLWSDSDNEALVEHYYPWFLGTYQSYSSDVNRRDAIRYMYMHRYGGVYADIDTESYKNIEPLLIHSLSRDNRPSTVLGQSSVRDSPDAVKHSLIASAPGSEFWLSLLQEMDAISHNDDFLPDELTGSRLLTRFVNAEIAKRNSAVVLAPSKYLYPFEGHLPQERKLCGQPGRGVYHAGNYTGCRSMYPEAYAISYWTERR